MPSAKTPQRLYDQYKTRCERLVGACFQNALRLHFDSIKLYRAASYPSALALSILSTEELAKVYIVEDVLWHGRVDGTLIDLDMKMYKDFFRSHHSKQRVFAHHAFSPKVLLVGDRVLQKGNWFWEMAQSGQLELAKQSALYVGLSKPRGRAKKIRIENPSHISSRSASRMVTVVSDYLIDLVLGSLDEYYEVESPHLRRIVSAQLYQQLSQAWPHRGRNGNRAITHYEKSRAG